VTGAATEQLTGLSDSPSRFDIPYADLRDLQVAAVNEQFQERKGRIRLVGHRAAEAGIEEVRSLEGIVPLLLPHTAYKSYPESFLTERRWDRLAKWLGTVSAYPIAPIDTADIADIDAWIARLEAAGHFVSCSSGTTGKSAMLIASRRDMEWSQRESVAAFSWGSGVAPAQDRVIFGLAPVAAVPRNLFIRDALLQAFGDPAHERFNYPVPPIMPVIEPTVIGGTG
jgi:hypothetical protein